MAGVECNVEPVSLTRLKLAFKCQAEHAQHAVKWRADFVAHAGKEVGSAARPMNRIFLGAYERPVTPLQCFVFVGYFPCSVVDFPLKLRRVVLHLGFGVPHLIKAAVDGIQVVVDNRDHQPDFIFLVVLGDWQPDLLRRFRLNLLQGFDNPQQRLCQYEIENKQ